MSRISPIRLVIAMLVAPVASPAAGQDGPDRHPSVELPAELDRVLRDYERAWRQGGRAVAALFTEDGFVLQPGRPPIRGRAAIAERIGSGGGPLSLRAIAFASEDSTAYIVGGYTYDTAQPDAGKFTLTLRLGADGRWLIFSDMDNNNGRPANRP